MTYRCSDSLMGSAQGPLWPRDDDVERERAAEASTEAVCSRTVKDARKRDEVLPMDVPSRGESMVCEDKRKGDCGVGERLIDKGKNCAGKEGSVGPGTFTARAWFFPLFASSFRSSIAVMVQKKGGLKRAERREPDPLPLRSKDAAVGGASLAVCMAPRIQTDLDAIATPDKPLFYPHLHDQQAATSSKAKTARKRGQSSKSLARAKLEKGVEKADRLRAKASKRLQHTERKKRVKEGQ